ncbi:MAG TPA: hypothetical protein ENI12_04365, partial [Nitrospirae bacterium]|nr:hypothetical protein [Nitrospirota bacterium]
LEATLMDYLDIEGATPKIPTMRMLLESAEDVRTRARRIASRIKGALLTSKAKKAEVSVIRDVTFSVGGCASCPRDNHLCGLARSKGCLGQ